MSQAKNPMKLFSGSEAIGKVVAMTPTTVPQSFMCLQGPGLVLDATNGIERMTIPEMEIGLMIMICLVVWLRIDFDNYQQRLAELLMLANMVY